MRTDHSLSFVLGLGLLVGAQTLAQPVISHDDWRQNTGQNTGQQPNAEPLFQLDEDGNPVPIDGPADLAALERNPLVSEEDMRAIRPHVAAWTDKLETVIVENIDLAVTLDNSALKDFDMKDAQNLMYVNDAVKMLSSLGSLTQYLDAHDALSDEQIQINRRLVNDFQRARMMYIGETAQREQADDVNEQIAIVTENNYREALRDAFWVYHRIVNALADDPDAIVDTVGDNDAVASEFDALASAEANDAVDLVRQILAKLDYEQQRQLAAKGLQLDKQDQGG